MAPTNEFTEREIDVSLNGCLWILSIPFTLGFLPYKSTLYLSKEEVTKTDIAICGKTVAKHPYGELGSVERGNCCCCVAADSAFGPISPGCGCDSDKVDDVVTVLKERMRARGDTAQIKRTEETLEQLKVVETKLNLIMEHMNIPQPEKMADRAPVLG